MEVEQINDFNKANEPFLIYGKIVAFFDDSDWKIEEVLFKSPYEKQYALDPINLSEYVDNENKAVFLSYCKEEC